MKTAGNLALCKKVFLFFLILLAFAGVGERGFAGHASPERVLENKYTVILLFIPNKENSLLRFIFRETQSGRNLSVPVKYSVSIKKTYEGVAVLENRDNETLNGIGEIIRKFDGGFYDIMLEFETAGEPGTIYRPAGWTLWIPGSGGNFYKRYLVGLPEIAGILALSAAVLFVLFSALRKHRTGKPLDLHFLGLFGAKNGEGRRLMMLKRHAKRRPSLN